MIHEAQPKTGTSSRAAAHTTATGGRSMPAVPVQLQHNSTTATPVVQRTPQDWARSPKIATILQHEPGFFSTWKKIKGAINDYKILPTRALQNRWDLLHEMQSLIAVWKAGHVGDTTQRVAGIRGVLPDLENLISHEQLEIRTAAYRTGGEMYTSATRPEIAFSIVKRGNNLEISSENPRISGNIEFVVANGAIDLRHFEAQPEGLGLGTVLMNEFARFTSGMGIEIVEVQTAALSAMGAYEAFGGIPRPGREDAFELSKGQYAAAMGLTNDQEHGEHIAEGHGDTSYDNFINEEAKAIGTTKVNKAEFENPGQGPEALAAIRSQAEQAHKDRNPRTVANVKRAARLKALSAFLSYKTSDLLDKTNAMMAGKWKIEK
ncbi:hypothetical protein [uncultured Chitinophaga sp.]|jgi:hypothetical protein|uniref:hypothetical protein n=1 Tax=uncultured Chitinophaga sp. TaxID=339340 RepID=UPI002601DF81|nr:hypothetical protein [uncultured Chitinophaga sp.]